MQTHALRMSGSCAEHQYQSHARHTTHTIHISACLGEGTLMGALSHDNFFHGHVSSYQVGQSGPQPTHTAEGLYP